MAKQQIVNKQTLPIEKRRNKILATKVNEEQYYLIKNKALKCGLTISDYLLICGCGCKPKVRLTPKQEIGIANLYGCRSDIVRFFATFNNLSAAQRKEVVRGPANILQWFKILANIGNRLSDFLDYVCAPNKLPEKKTNKESSIL